MRNIQVGNMKINSKNEVIKVNIVNLFMARFKDFSDDILSSIDYIEDYQILEEIFVNILKVENLDEFNIILKKVNKLD